MFAPELEKVEGEVVVSVYMCGHVKAYFVCVSVLVCVETTLWWQPVAGT